jgi:hypothetical protein
MQQQLFEILNDTVEKSSGMQIYALFDGVKCPMLWSSLEEGVLEYDMLFREEELRNKMLEVAPYLVALNFTDKEHQEESRELLECYGKKGCIFLSTTLDFAKTLETIRELFYIYTPSGEKGYMRFYDPAIFRKYIEQKDSNIIYALFDGIEHYWCEDEDNAIVVQYTLKNNRVTKTPLRLKKEPV